MAKTRQQLLDEENDRINKLADQQSKRLGMNSGVITPTPAVGPLPTSVGTGEQVPVGMIRDATGKLVTADQMKVGLQSAAVAPDLTNQVMAAQSAGQKPQPVQPGQPFIQLGGGQTGAIPLTNQQFNSAAARSAAASGGITNVTPMGTFSAPLNTNANFSASATPGIVETPQQRADREARQFAQSRANTQMMQTPIMQTRTVESGNARVRQLEQDKINEGLLSASQRQQDAKLTADVMGKVLPAQIAGQSHVAAAGMAVGRDAQGNPLPGANQPEQYVEGDDGVLRGAITGKPAPDNVRKQVAANKMKQGDIEAARGLDSAMEKTPNRFTAFFGAKPDVYGKNVKTGEFKIFGSQEELEKDKNHVPMTPEERQAMTEGRRRQTPQSAAPTPTGLQGAGTAQPMIAGQPVITGQPAVPAQPAGNQYAGAKLDFGSEQEAAAAGLPPGTIITIAGRRARVK